MTCVDTVTIARAMRILSRDIRPHNTASSDAALEAAERMESLVREVHVLREALDWYAQSSNWRREVRVAGPHRNWIKSPAAFDRGARAKFVLMCASGRSARDDQMGAE